jgi:hypothetical protein
MIKRGLIIVGVLILSIFIFNSFSTKDITGKQVAQVQPKIEGISCSPIPESDLSRASISVIERSASLSDEQLEAVKQSVLNELGARPLNYFNYIDEVTEAKLIDAILHASDQVSDNPHGITVSPELLFIMSMIEGLDLWMDNFYYTKQDSKISGFSYLGLHDFDSEVTTLKNLGFLRRDYSGFTIQTSTNRRGERVASAVFDNIDIALEGMAAEIAYRQYLFLQDARAAGYNINDFSEEEKIFWTYLYFNPGPTFAKRNLIQNKDYCCSSNVCCYWPREQLSRGEAVRNAKYLSLQGVATYEWVKRMEIFA